LENELFIQDLINNKLYMKKENWNVKYVLLKLLWYIAEKNSNYIKV
jgi:hypothetical protein